MQHLQTDSDGDSCAVLEGGSAAKALLKDCMTEKGLMELFMG